MNPNSPRGRYGSRGAGANDPGSVRNQTPNVRENLELRHRAPQRGASQGNIGDHQGGQRPSKVYESPGNLVIDQATRHFEMDYAQKVDGSESEEFPPRPGFANLGREIKVWTNYVRLKVPNIIIYRHHMDIRPTKSSSPAPQGKKLKRVIQLLIQEQPKLSATRSDMSSQLYGLQNLLTDGVQYADYRVRYRSEEQDIAAENASEYKVRITSAGHPLETKQLHEYLQMRSPSCESKMEIVQAINSILSHFCHMQNSIMTIRNNSSHFCLDAVGRNREDLGRGMLAVRGFFKSTRPATGGLLVNVNVTSAVIYNPLPLPDLAVAFGTADRSALERFLYKVRVKVLHLKESRNKAGSLISNVRTVCGLAHEKDGANLPDPPQAENFGGPKEVIFTAEINGAKFQRSVWDHFTAHHHVRMDERLPVVCTGDRNRNPVYLPMEVCEVVPGQLCRENLTTDQRTKLIKFTCRKPQVNAESIVNEGLPSLGLTNEVLSRYRFVIKPTLEAVPAFVLNAPELLYRSRKKTNQLQPLVTQHGSWHMKNSRFHTGAVLEKDSWTYVWIYDDKRDKQGRLSNNPFGHAGGNPSSTVDDLAREMKNCGIDVRQRMNVTLEIGLKPICRQQDVDDNSAKIKAQIQKTFIQYKEKLRLMLVIFPYNSVSYYNAVKTFFDTTAGLHCVLVVADKFACKGPQYFANVALKINMKLDGINHVSNAPELHLVKSGKTLVCGLDVTHPSPGSNRNAPSIVGMVCAMDKDLARWHPWLWLQHTERREMAQGLKDKFVSALNEWQNRNKRLPENILFCRDGVSEGQYNQVLRLEINEQVRVAMKEVYGPGRPLPRLTVVVVGKRHHTRLYPTNPKDMDPQTFNCLPGTVVDRGITDAHSWDFFQIAHKALQGTARPAHYYVIVDEIFRNTSGNTATSAEGLMKLIHAMPYLYPRATKAVSVVPPAKMADLLCDRGRRYLWKYYDPRFKDQNLPQPTERDVQVHDKLKGTMYYI